MSEAQGTVLPVVRRAQSVAAIAETIFTVATFCALSGSLEQLRYGMLSVAIMRGLTGLLLGFSALFILLLRNDAITASMKYNWPNLLLVALAGVSVGWSIAPPLTLTHAFEFFAATVFALYVAARFSPLQLLDLLLAALSLVVVYSLIAMLFASHGATWTDHGLEVRGWYTSNNHLGRSMSLAVITAVIAAFGPGRRWSSIAAGAICFVVMMASDSRSAMIVTFLCVGGFWLLTVAQRSRRRARTLFGIAGGLGCLVGLAVASNAAWMLGWIGRGPSLSNRTVLWGLLLEQWAQRPWLGYGFGAFWQGRTGPSGEVAQQLGNYPWHAHNGFLDLGLDLGIIGVAAFLFLLIFFGRRALRVSLKSQARWALWPLVYLGYFVVSNLTESELVRHDSIYWVLYLIAAAHTVPLAATGRTGPEPFMVLESPVESGGTAEKLD